MDGVSVQQLYELLARTRTELLGAFADAMREHREEHRRVEAATVARSRWAIATSLTALATTVTLASAIFAMISGGGS